ncbi:MAG TPA: zf-HC2 domain-containing protein [Pyrinomonadaceae bacterium]|nr:zf-HC2 domain-containing protein [Pyrinomonadaceae bacterium]
MGQTRKAGFCKDEGCPPSQGLYAFQNGDISGDEAREIRLHLRTCEFCTAETEFYEHYPQQAEITEPDTIPEPLFELASALLKKDRDELLIMDDIILN